MTWILPTRAPIADTPRPVVLARITALRYKRRHPDLVKAIEKRQNARPERKAAKAAWREANRDRVNARARELQHRYRARKAANERARRARLAAAQLANHS